MISNLSTGCRLSVDINYVESRPSTYSGLILEINTKETRKVVIFRKASLPIDTIDMIMYAYSFIEFKNIIQVNYTDKYFRYLKESKKFKEKKYAKSLFNLVLPKEKKGCAIPELKILYGEIGINCQPSIKTTKF